MHSNFVLNLNMVNTQHMHINTLAYLRHEMWLLGCWSAVGALLFPVYLFFLHLLNFVCLLYSYLLRVWYWISIWNSLSSHLTYLDKLSHSNISSFFTRSKTTTTTTSNKIKIKMIAPSCLVYICTQAIVIMIITHILVYLSARHTKYQIPKRDTPKWAAYQQHSTGILQSIM